MEVHVAGFGTSLSIPCVVPIDLRGQKKTDMGCCTKAKARAKSWMVGGGLRGVTWGVMGVGWGLANGWLGVSPTTNHHFLSNL